jgi:hypothetical protein
MIKKLTRLRGKIQIEKESRKNNKKGMKKRNKSKMRSKRRLKHSKRSKRIRTLLLQMDRKELLVDHHSQVIIQTRMPQLSKL